MYSWNASGAFEVGIHTQSIPSWIHQPVIVAGCFSKNHYVCTYNIYIYMYNIHIPVVQFLLIQVKLELCSFEKYIKKKYGFLSLAS